VTKPVTRLCPLRREPCAEDYCAWYEPHNQECSVLTLCRLLDELNATLEAKADNAEG